MSCKNYFDENAMSRKWPGFYQTKFHYIQQNVIGRRPTSWECQRKTYKD